MTDVEQIWRDKTDDEVAEAASNLSEYTEEAAPVIRAEFQRRGLSEPETDVVVPIPDEDMRCVFVASGLDQANQIVAFLEAPAPLCRGAPPRCRRRDPGPPGGASCVGRPSTSCCRSHRRRFRP
ncbi:MAG: hypothetical protein ACXVH7_03575, partial [Thermoanaerobaculia bacterium]